MRSVIALLATAILTATLGVGCDREAKVETKEKVTSPGGSTETTTTKKVESSGDNPPANSSGQAVPK